MASLNWFECVFITEDILNFVGEEKCFNPLPFTTIIIWKWIKCFKELFEVDYNLLNNNDLFSSLSVEEDVALLHQLSGNEEFKGADTFICPPSQEYDFTDEDCGPEKTIYIGRISSQQLRSPATVTLKRFDKSVEYLGDFYLSSDDEYPHDPTSCKRKKNKCRKIPKERIWAEMIFPMKNKTS